LVGRDAVKAQPQEPPPGAGAEKAIAAGVVGDDGAVLGGAQVVAPRLRCVGPGDDILPGLVVEIAVPHAASLARQSSGAPAAFNRRSARKVTHLFGWRLGPNSTQVLPA